MQRVISCPASLQLYFETESRSLGNPLRVFSDAPKIYEMCLHVPLCKRGCRGGIASAEKARVTHAFNTASEKVRFSNESKAKSEFHFILFLFTLVTNKQAPG